MPKLPTAADLGTRAIGVPSLTPASPNEFAAPARAVQQVGATVTGMAEREYERRTNFAVATAKSDYLRRSIAAQTEIAQTPDYNTWEPEYQSRMNEARGDIAKTIQDPRAREAFDLEMNDNLTVAKAKIADMARGKHIETQRGGLSQLVNDNATALLGTADEAERNELLNTTNQAIDGAVANQVIDANEAVTMKRAHLDRYLSGRADTLDPVSRIEALSQGMTRNAQGQASFRKNGTWVDFIDPDVRLKMIEAAEIDRDRDTRIKNAAKAEKVRGIQNDFVSKLAAGTLTAGEVLNNPDIEPIEGAGSKQDWMNMMRLRNERGPDWPTNPQLFADLFDLVHREDGDPEKIVDENDLNQYVAPGQLNITQFGQLRAEIQGRRTAEGSVEGDLKRRFATSSRTAITGSTEVVSDPRGDNLHLKFMTWFLPEYERQRKAGKTPVQLLNPDSPDYMGPEKFGQLYIRPIDERLAATLGGFNPMMPGAFAGVLGLGAALNRSDGRPANAPTAAPADRSTVTTVPEGLVRPAKRNPRSTADYPGGIEAIGSIEVTEDGVPLEVLTIARENGRDLSREEMMQKIKEGHDFGAFETPAAATAFAKKYTADETKPPASKIVGGPPGATLQRRNAAGDSIYKVGDTWVDRTGKPLPARVPTVK
jgi:hypothetical protein